MLKQPKLICTQNLSINLHIALIEIKLAVATKGQTNSLARFKTCKIINVQVY